MKLTAAQTKAITSAARGAYANATDWARKALRTEDKRLAQMKREIAREQLRTAVELHAMIPQAEINAPAIKKSLASLGINL